MGAWALRWLVVVAMLLATVSVAAQGRSGSPVATEEPRLALVIGNGMYREAPLRNPVNDARAMAQTLRELGFTVIAHENATKRTLETAVLEFGRRLAGGGVGLFYYAGHGLQVRGRNYLVPVDAEIDFEAAARVQAVDVDLLLEQMAEAKNRVNVVILDACRNNPFERRLRGAASRGLAPIDAARGTLIAYATAPGAVAADGDGANGLYTGELLKTLRIPGLKVEEVFKRVRVSVSERSKGGQTPWESSSLTGDLVVNVSVQVTAPAAGTADREALFWSSIKDSTDPGALEAYLKQYPQGVFADLARVQLAALSRLGSTPAGAAPVPPATAALPPGAAPATPGATAAPPGTPGRRFDGPWTGFARDTEGIKGCADSAELQVTVTGTVLRGTIRQPSGDLANFSAEVLPDGSVASRGFSGRFTESEFKGRWQRRGSRANCAFEITLKRQ